MFQAIAVSGVSWSAICVPVCRSAWAFDDAATRNPLRHPRPRHPVECAFGDALSSAAADASVRQRWPMAGSDHSAAAEGGQQFGLGVKLHN